MGKKRADVIQLEPICEEFLALKGVKTAEIYRTSFRYFTQWYREKYDTKKPFEDFLNKLYENLSLPVREQSSPAETILNEYIRHLILKKFSNNTIRNYFAGLQNFLKWKHIPVSSAFIGNLPDPTGLKKNKKHPWKLEQIKQFVDMADSIRDKAIILCLFQSGMAIGELCALNYFDVKKELEDNILPLRLDIIRGKTSVEYRTFLGADAIKYLSMYLETRKGIKDDDPLFTVERANGLDKERLTDGAIQKKFDSIAEKLEFINKNGDGYNPARPHSLRAAFRSRLTGNMDGQLIEFFMGHQIGETAGAYLNKPEDELRENYAKWENELSIETTSLEVNAGKAPVNKFAEALGLIKAREKDVSDLKITQGTLIKSNVELLTQLNQLRSDLPKMIEYVVEPYQQATIDFAELLLGHEYASNEEGVPYEPDSDGMKQIRERAEEMRRSMLPVTELTQKHFSEDDIKKIKDFQKRMRSSSKTQD